MVWPWKREKRNYTEQELAAVQATVTGAAASVEPARVAAVETSASLWGRAMASGRVAGRAGAVLTPAVLYDVGRSLVLAGEAVYRLVAGAAGVVAMRCAAWDISGMDTWTYRVSVDYPNGTRTASVPGAAVLHPRINTSPSASYRGRSPVTLADTTMRMLAGIEGSLRREAAAGTGYVIPAPIEGMEDSDFDNLVADIRALNGGTRMVPSMEGGFGDATAAGRLRSNNNWNPQRLGLSPPAELVSLRSDAALAVLGACGVPPELFAGDSDGTGRREAWRQFLHGTIQPVADVVAVEFAEKLEAPVRFDFDGLFASDVQGRGRAFQSLTGGGLSVADAARATGVQVSGAPAEGVTGA